MQIQLGLTVLSNLMGVLICLQKCYLSLSFLKIEASEAKSVRGGAILTKFPLTRVTHISADAGVTEESRAGVRHFLAAVEVKVLELGAAGGDRREPAVRHVHAGDEVEVLELGAAGGDRR